MKLTCSQKNKMDFYMINYKQILSGKCDKEITLRTPFKARKCNIQKFIKTKLTEEDYKWSKAVKSAIENIQYEKVVELVELSYLSGKDIHSACEKLGIVDSTYFLWTNNIRFYALYYAVADGLIDKSEIKNIVQF